MQKTIFLSILGLLTLLASSCSSNPVPENKVNWAMSYSEAKDMLKDFEITSPGDGYKALKVVEGSDTIQYFYSEAEQKLLLINMQLPKVKVENLKSYFEKQGNVENLYNDYYCVVEGDQTILFGPQKEDGCGMSYIHNCPQLTSFLDNVKKDDDFQARYKDCSTTALGVKLFFVIAGTIAYGVPPLEGYYTTANAMNILAARRLLMSGMPY